MSNKTDNHSKESLTQKIKTSVDYLEGIKKDPSEIKKLVEVDNFTKSNLEENEEFQKQNEEFQKKFNAQGKGMIQEINTFLKQNENNLNEQDKGELKSYVQKIEKLLKEIEKEREDIKLKQIKGENHSKVEIIKNVKLLKKILKGIGDEQLLILLTSKSDVEFKKDISRKKMIQELFKIYRTMNLEEKKILVQEIEALKNPVSNQTNKDYYNDEKEKNINMKNIDGVVNLMDMESDFNKIANFKGLFDILKKYKSVSVNVNNYLKEYPSDLLIQKIETIINLYRRGEKYNDGGSLMIAMNFLPEFLSEKVGNLLKNVKVDSEKINKENQKERDDKKEEIGKVKKEEKIKTDKVSVSNIDSAGNSTSESNTETGDSEQVAENIISNNEDNEEKKELKYSKEKLVYEIKQSISHLKNIKNSSSEIRKLIEANGSNDDQEGKLIQEINVFLNDNDKSLSKGEKRRLESYIKEINKLLGEINIKKEKYNILALKRRLAKAEKNKNEAEIDIYKSLLDNSKREIKINKKENKQFKKTFFEKVSNLTQDALFSMKKQKRSVSANIVNGVNEKNTDDSKSEKTKKFYFISESKARIINSQIYNTMGRVFAFKAITDWLGYGVAKLVGESKLFKGTKLGEKMSAMGNRTDVYKFFEQKENTKEDRKKINDNFQVVLETIQDQNEIYFLDDDYNRKYERLTNNIEEQVKDIREKYTIPIKQLERDIEFLGQNKDNNKKEIEDKNETINKLKEEQKKAIRSLKKISEERHQLKVEQIKKNKNSEYSIEENENGKENIKISSSLQDKIKEYNEIIEKGFSPEFYDLAKNEREKIKEKIKDDNLSSEEKYKYLLSVEDKSSLKRRLGEILLENVYKKIENTEKMNKEITNVTKDYIRGKVRATALIKDAVNSAIVLTTGVAGAGVRGIAYAGLAIAERIQDKILEYNKKYQTKNKEKKVIGKKTFLMKDAFFNSTLELYYGLSGKEFKVSYKKDIYGQKYTTKDVKKLEGIAAFALKAKSIGKLIRFFSIGGQATTSLINKGANFDAMIDSFKNTFTSSGDGFFKETFINNLYGNAKNIVDINRKIESLKNLKHIKHNIGSIFNKKIHHSNGGNTEISSQNSLINENQNQIVENNKVGNREHIPWYKRLLGKGDKKFNNNDQKVGNTTLNQTPNDSSVVNKDSTKVDTTNQVIKADTTSTSIKDDVSSQDQYTENVNNEEQGEIYKFSIAMENKSIDRDIQSKIFDLDDKTDGKIGQILTKSENMAVIKPGQGISQALGVNIKDSDLVATVINPDGSVIRGDLNLVHTGDTVIQGSDNEIYILKTSQIKVSKDDSLAKAWIKTTEKDFGHHISDKIIDKYDGEDNKMDWQEAKHLHDDLISKKNEYLKKIEILNKEEEIKKAELKDLERLMAGKNGQRSDDISEINRSLAERVIKNSASNQEILNNIKIQKNQILEDLKSLQKKHALLDSEYQEDFEESITNSNEEVYKENNFNQQTNFEKDYYHNNSKNKYKDPEPNINRKIYNANSTNTTNIDSSISNGLNDAIFSDDNNDHEAVINLFSIKDTNKIIKFNHAIKLKPDNTFLVNRFQFKKTDSLGNKHFLFFKNSNNGNSPDGEVVLRFNENEGNIVSIKVEDVVPISQDNFSANDNNTSKNKVSTKNIDVQNSQLKITEEHYTELLGANASDSEAELYNVINKTNSSSLSKPIELESPVALKLKDSGQKISILSFKLKSVDGDTTDGEVTKTFEAFDKEGNKYILFAKETWVKNRIKETNGNPSLSSIKYSLEKEDNHR